MRTVEKHAGTPRYPIAPVPLADAERAWWDLRTEALSAGVRSEVVRLAVVVGLTRATGARYGDLLRCGVDDLAPDRGSVRLAHGKHRVARVHELDDTVRHVLDRWDTRRAELCAELEGSVPRALLLTVHHTHDNGTTVAAGLPITRQGLVLSWRRYVQRTNARNVGLRPPLPTRFEQLRRAWTTAAQEEDI